MDPRLERRANRIIQQHPNLIRQLFKNIKANLPFGMGEGKVKDALADNIPGWVYDLSESDLKEFIETLQRDPDFYIWLKYLISDLAKYIDEE